jgi:hypothetical protein
VGVARSGTTLLQRLLDGHPRLYAIHRETHVVDWCGAPDPVAAFLARRRSDGEFFPDAGRREALVAHLRERIRGPVPLHRALRILLDGLVRLQPPPPGATTWVEKTPKHLRWVPALRSAFGPGTRFLCLVRDPRAVMSSQFQKWRRGEEVHVRTFAARWIEADDLALRLERTVPGFLALRYEDLVADPRGSARRAAEHLGVGWDDALLNPTDRGRAWRGNSSTKERVDGVSDAALDRWEERLDPAAVLELEHLLAPRMEARGYPLRNPAAARPSVRRLYLEAAARLRARKDVV